MQNTTKPPSFAVRMARRCIQAGRQAMHASLQARAYGLNDQAAVLREFARMNLEQAKATKSRAIQAGTWSV